MRRIYNAILAVGGIALLLTGLAAINTDMRRYIVNAVHGDARELVIAAAPIDRAARIAVATLNDFHNDNGHLFAFAVAAVVLFALLFRS
jgi:hypothetical protein